MNKLKNRKKGENNYMTMSAQRKGYVKNNRQPQQIQALLQASLILQRTKRSLIRRNSTIFQQLVSGKAKKFWKSKIDIRVMLTLNNLLIFLSLLELSYKSQNQKQINRHSLKNKSNRILPHSQKNPALVKSKDKLRFLLLKNQWTLSPHVQIAKTYKKISG